jgi:hypothetical protein
MYAWSSITLYHKIDRMSIERLIFYKLNRPTP